MPNFTQTAKKRCVSVSLAKHVCNSVPPPSRRLVIEEFHFKKKKNFSLLRKRIVNRY